MLHSEFKNFIEISIPMYQMSSFFGLFSCCYFLLLQVAGLCKLLNQNSRTLTSLELVHCKISSSFMDTICGSLCSSGAETHQIHHFSISSSSFHEIDPVSLAHSLASFLSSGRYIYHFKLHWW